MTKFFLKQPGAKQPPGNSGSPPEVSIPTAKLHETLINQIKNKQEIIPNLLKDSHSIEDTNPEVVC